MFLKKGILGLLIVKYKIIPLFCLSVWIVKNLSPELHFLGIENIFRYILPSFQEVHVSAFLGLIREFKIYDATLGRMSLIIASSSFSNQVIISVCVTFES